MITETGIFQITVYLTISLVFVKPLGWYMVQVYERKNCILDRVFSSLERFIYRACSIEPEVEMSWKMYLIAMLMLNLFGMLAAYFIQLGQFYLPLNPQGFSAPHSDSIFNTAISFVTNTDWQSYSGETTMSYLTQMLALTVQNFLSAATSMALMIALIRGVARHETKNLGNFWVDVIRGTLYILLPLALILSLILVSQGVIQNLKPYQTVDLIQPVAETTQQTLAMGPVASQVAIKQLTTNGGGFFNTNAAHPFENPTPLTNLLECLAMFLIPTAFCYTFGSIVRDKRQGWAILATMYVIAVPFIFATATFEQQGNPAFTKMGINQTPQHGLSPGGNMEGKETRFGIVSSAIWAITTTSLSNGSVNSMHDSYTPLGGMGPLAMMHIGEIVFGGVRSGLYGLLMLIIITVFVAGSMIGRAPAFLGKKIDPFEMKMAVIAALIMPLVTLALTAIASVTVMGTSSIGNLGPHGFSEMLYAFSSMASNNGSSFAGLNANTPFYNIAGGIAMLLSRYWIAIPALAIAGSLARKKITAPYSGSLVTYSPLFIILLVSVIIIIGALSFFPALALGPVVEHLILWGQYGR